MNEQELLSWLAWWQTSCMERCGSKPCFIVGGDKKRCERAYQEIKKMIGECTGYTKRAKTYEKT